MFADSASIFAMSALNNERREPLAVGFRLRLGQHFEAEVVVGRNVGWRMTGARIARIQECQNKGARRETALFVVHAMLDPQGTSGELSLEDGRHPELGLDL